MWSDHSVKELPGSFSRPGRDNALCRRGGRQRAGAAEGESPAGAPPTTTGGSDRQRNARLPRCGCEARSPSRPRAVEQVTAQPPEAEGWRMGQATEYAMLGTSQER